MNDRITRAVAAATLRDRPFASRYQAAGRLLGRGWQAQSAERKAQSGETNGVTFADGATSDGRRCDCQEGGHLECLHKIAARLLDEAEKAEAEAEEGDDWRHSPALRYRKVPDEEVAHWI